MARTSAGLSDPGEAFAGALLVATPLIDEPTFRRSVVLILEHDEAGTLGVVINDLSAVPVSEVVPGWETVLHSRIALGGPVQADAGVAVVRLTEGAALSPPDGVRPLGGVWAVIDLEREPLSLASALADGQLFVGYAGWAAGQLAAELEQGSWWVVDSLPGDLDLARHSPREYCWSRVLRRQPNDLRLASTFPSDPAMN